MAQLNDRRVRHGMYGHPLYKIWEGMLSRCEKENDPFFATYGGRGITVCERWHDLRLFVADIEREIGPRPTETYPSGRFRFTLDRINNDGGYEPGNVRWATMAQQAGNRRRRAVTSRREPVARQPRTETCEQCGDEYQTLAAASGRFLRFCSRKCKAKNRRDSGVDNIERACHQCGGTFSINRYEKTSHCGQSCAAVCQHAGGCHPR